MTTFVNTNTQAAAEAAAAAEAKSTKRVKLDSLKSSDFAKTTKNKLGRPTRFVPPVSGMTLPWLTVKKHELRDPYVKNAQMITSWACPRHHGGGRCLLCEMEEAVAGNDKELAYMLRAKDRYLSLDVRIEEGSPILRKYEFGSTVQKALLSLINDRHLDFSSLTKGFPIDILYDKTAAPALMWKADRPDDTSPKPFKDEVIEAIAEAYPAGGLTSLLFLPDVVWQYKEFVTGKLQGLILPWNRVSNLPNIGEEQATAGVASHYPESAGGASVYRGATGAISKEDLSVAHDDDIPF